MKYIMMYIYNDIINRLTSYIIIYNHIYISGGILFMMSSEAANGRRPPEGTRVPEPPRSIQRKTLVGMVAQQLETDDQNCRSDAS